MNTLSEFKNHEKTPTFKLLVYKRLLIQSNKTAVQKTPSAAFLE